MAKFSVASQTVFDSADGMIAIVIIEKPKTTSPVVDKMTKRTGKPF
jgi:hypothetical protein